ncbi:GTP cyclohydrolase FolE2 [Modicisalibacter xianhensis]|uniref:GTP cyclohydrolase FolE2 n=1 Tax=Modicisalibacter xianhensis TaxID=442341 RepID=A0A1I3DNR8_9GAMM|nr:GTP cyclohydrolase FolE2 [Halomonas xianhensis]SFH88382.1 GTP cyclohydrolase I [Halomonas xianhensis]
MTQHELIDVAQGASVVDGTLAWVGMEAIALPFQVGGQPVNGQVSAGVSLDDPLTRGIHMSRLYLALAELENQELTLPRVAAVLENYLDSHAALSDTAFLDLRGEVLIKRPALISPLAGWKAYPFTLRCRRDGRGLQAMLDLTVGYSSTCPCSAALARQLIQQAFDEDFTDMPISREAVRAWLGSEQGILATPHSQRSQAHLSLRLADGIEKLPIEALIDDVERSLGTALQTAVKRIDEQAFTLANGQNLMFCEDAARRLHRTLRRQASVDGFQLRVVHAESLHAHDAVARSEWNWTNA